LPSSIWGEDPGVFRELSSSFSFLRLVVFFSDLFSNAFFSRSPSMLSRPSPPELSPLSWQALTLFFGLARKPLLLSPPRLSFHQSGRGELIKPNFCLSPLGKKRTNPVYSLLFAGAPHFWDGRHKNFPLLCDLLAPNDSQFPPPPMTAITRSLENQRTGRFSSLFLPALANSSC